jgi:hypothetical protein
MKIVMASTTTKNRRHGKFLRILTKTYLVGFVLTWALDIIQEAHHFDEYQGYNQFIWQMIDHGLALLFVWIPAVSIQIGLWLGWIPWSPQNPN